MGTVSGDGMHNGREPIMEYRRKVEDAVDAVRREWDERPALGLILGTGLGALAGEIDVEESIPYSDLPSFPDATVETHEGRLLLGRLDGYPIIAMQGRYHLYEGYSPRQVTLPVRVMGLLGIETLLISNAAGGMNPQFSAGDLMLITDHINFMGVNPLVGENIDEWGPRFPDMSDPYDSELRSLAVDAALEQGIHLHQGVYVSVIGPNLETPAEYRLLRMMGADVVGMSTVPEVIVARHMDIRTMAISVITDECLPDALEPIDIEKVMAAAGRAEPDLTLLVKSVVNNLTKEVEANV